MRWLVAALIAFLVAFVFLDSPVREARALIGAAGEDASSRQAISSLQIAIDLNGRRQGRRVGVLVQDWLYCYPPTGDVFLVPRGYETDFASIPPLAQGLINPFGNHAEAAVVHDWLYAVGEKDRRKEADDIFRFAMKEGGVNLVRRNVMHRAVRTGGEKAYGQAKEWRFRDPDTLYDAEPPFARPTKAAVTRIDCQFLSRETPDILSAFGTARRALDAETPEPPSN